MQAHWKKESGRHCELIQVQVWWITYEVRHSQKDNGRRRAIWKRSSELSKELGKKCEGSKANIIQESNS